MTATDDTATQGRLPAAHSHDGLGGTPASVAQARRAPAATSPLTPARAAAGPIPRQPLVTSWSADTRWPDSIHWPSSPPPPAPVPAPVRGITQVLPGSVAAPAPARAAANGARPVSRLTARRASFSGGRAVVGAALTITAAALPTFAPGLSLGAGVVQVDPSPAIMGVVALAAAGLMALALLVVGVASVRERGAANVVPSLVRTVIAVGLGAGVVALVAPAALAVLPAIAGAAALVALVQGAVARVLSTVTCVAAVALVHGEALTAGDLPLAAGLAATGAVLGLRLVVSALSQPAPARELLPAAAPTEPVWAPGRVDLTAFLPQREYAGDVWQDAR